MGPYIRRSLGNGRAAGFGNGPGGICEVELRFPALQKRLKSLVDLEFGFP
jgi:hypothetical protein